MNKDQWHQSQRGYFAGALYNEMQRDDSIWLVSIDLGYKVFDRHFESFPDRCINTGASEQAAMDLSVGLALEGQKPFIYSITPFLLWRPAEAIRLYVDHEQIPVRLVGSGRNQDYAHDGFSHDARDAERFLNQFPNIKQFWPEDKEYIPSIVQDMVEKNRPSFISLSR